MPRSCVGVFVDVPSVSRNGGYGMRYDVLRAFACRDSSEPVRLNAYVAFDQDRATTDAAYRATQENYYALLRDFGYKIVKKVNRVITDEAGNRCTRANTDFEMAVDVLIQAERFTRVVLVTGDGEFARVSQALQSCGCRVEVIGFENVSSTLRREADAFYSGYTIPSLLPALVERADAAPWGEPGSRVRGVCYNHHEKGYGLFRFLRRISADLWKIDSRQDDSPFATAFFHDSNLPPDINAADLPNRHYIFEFELVVDETRNRGLVARNILLASPRRRPLVRPLTDSDPTVLTYEPPAVPVASAAALAETK